MTEPTNPGYHRRLLRSVFPPHLSTPNRRDTINSYDSKQIRTSRYIINNIGVQQVLFLRVIENLSVFQQQNRHYSFGDAYVAHKNTVENASLNTLRTSTVERARVPAIAFHGQNIRYKGLGDDFKRWTDQLTVARPISFRM